MEKLKCSLPELSDYFVDEAVPVFYDEDGEYTPDDLQHICQVNNARVENTCDMTAVSIGHTPDNGEEGEPPVIGFATNFRLADWQGKPTIVVDHFIRHEHKEDYYAHPRRSIELWGNYKIDPISVLGESPPARDLGLRFEKNGIKKYTLRATYSQSIGGPLDEQIKAFLKAFEESEMGQFLKSLMADKAAEEEAELPEKMEEAEVKDEEKEAFEEEEQEDVAPEKYKLKYEQAQRKVKKFEAALQGLESQVKTLERNGRLSERKADLMNLEAQGIIFDIAEELDLVSDMEPKKYSAHLQHMVKRYQKAPVTSALNPMLRPANIPDFGGPKIKERVDYRAIADAYSSGKLDKKEALNACHKGGN